MGCGPVVALKDTILIFFIDTIANIYLKLISKVYQIFYHSILFVSLKNRLNILMLF